LFDYFSIRYDLVLNVTVEAGGSVWEGTTVDISQGGAKIALSATWARVPLGTSVQLKVALPDNRPPISVHAPCMALLFLGLQGEAFERLRALIESLCAQTA
jgi:hypothetical protein